MAETSSWSAILGGRWAISLKGYLWIAGPVVLTVPLIELAKGSDQHLLAWATASAIGYALAGIPLLIAHKTWFRNRATHPRHWLETVILGLLAGSAKGLGTGVVALQLSAATPGLGNAVARVPTAALVGATELLIGAVLLSAVERLERSRLALLDERVRFSQLQIQEEQLGEAMRTVVFKDAEHDLKAAFSELRRHLHESDQASVERQWKSLSEAITNAAHNRLRNLSHTLWEKSKSAEGRTLSLLDLLRLSVRREPLSPALVSVVYIGSQLTLVSTWQSWQTTAVVSTVDVLAIFALERVLRRLLRERNRPSLTIIVGLLGFVAALFAMQPAMLGYLSWTTSATTLIPLNMLWFTFLCLSSSLWKTLLTQPDSLLDELQNDVSESKVRALAAQRETKRLAGELAKFVHGTLQSRLMVASLQANSSAALDDNVLHNLKRTIDAPLQAFMQPDASSLSAALAQTCADWAGLVDVRTDQQIPDSDCSPTDIRFLKSVVDEAVANASRHGWADRVDVQITREARTLTLSVRDNGIGPRIGEPGLGTKVYSSDSRATWTLEQNASGGAELRLTLAVE